MTPSFACLVKRSRHLNTRRYLLVWRNDARMFGKQQAMAKSVDSGKQKGVYILCYQHTVVYAGRLIDGPLGPAHGMHPTLLKLQKGDRRSIGRSNEVVAEVLSNPRLFRVVFSELSAGDPLIRMRSADAVEKITAQGPDLLRSYKNKLIRVAAAAYPRRRVAPADAPWEIRQRCVPRLPHLNLNPHPIEQAPLGARELAQLLQFRQLLRSRKDRCIAGDLRSDQHHGCGVRAAGAYGV